MKALVIKGYIYIYVHVYVCVCVINVVQLLQIGVSTQPKLGVKNWALNPQPQGNMEAQALQNLRSFERGDHISFQVCLGVESCVSGLGVLGSRVQGLGCMG